MWKIFLITIFDEENAIPLEIETGIDPVVKFHNTTYKASIVDVSSNAAQPSQVKKETKKRIRFSPII